jgi:hypothetical protein
MAERVDLTELNVISRYSLAVRAATADRDDLVAALREDLSWLEASSSDDAPATSRTRATPDSGARDNEARDSQAPASRLQAQSRSRRSASQPRTSASEPRTSAAKRAATKNTSAAKRAATKTTKKAPAKRATRERRR